MDNNYSKKLLKIGKYFLFDIEEKSFFEEKMSSFTT